MSEIKLTLPISEETIRSLHVGDDVLISGIIVTGRDLAHAYLSNENNQSADIAKLLNEGAIFHCGPVINYKENAKSEIVSIGPTTSIRMSAYTEKILEHFHVRLIIGKGGLDENSIPYLKKYGSVYLALIGGTAVYTAKYFTKVENVYLRDIFGDSEAMWVLSCENMKAVVAMDSHGKSLYKETFLKSSDIYNKIMI